MKFYDIEIPGLPDGWRPVAHRQVNCGENYFDCGIIRTSLFDGKTISSYLVVEKIKRKRIILEETGETRMAEDGEWVEFGIHFYRWNCTNESSTKYKIWREVKE